MTRVHPAILALLIFLAGLGAGVTIGVVLVGRGGPEAVDAKVLARELMDESRRMMEEQRDSFTCSAPATSSRGRREVLFYQPGNEAIWSDLTEIPAGDGILKGSLLVDGKPGQGVRVAAILAVGKKTVSVPVDADGNFSIPIPRGTYNLNGFLIDDPEQKAAGRLLVTLDLDGNELGVDGDGCAPALVS